MIWKAGQKVKRIQDSWHGMKEGHIGTLNKDVDTKQEVSLYLKEYGGGHSVRCFVLCNNNLKSLLEELKWVINVEVVEMKKGL